MHRLDAAQRRSHCLDGGADDVVERLLRGEGRTSSEDEDAQLLRARILRAVGIAHELGPYPARGPELRDLRHEIHVARQKGEEGGSHRVDADATDDALIEIRTGIREREGDLLDCVRPRFTNVVPAHRERDPARDISGDVLHHVDRELEAGGCWEDLRAAGDVLLEDVVLDEHAELVRVHPALRRESLEHRDPDVANRVRGRADLADLLERDSLHEDFDVGEAVDRDADLADLTARECVIGVEPHLSGKVECNAEAGEPLVDERTEACVRLACRSEARVLTHCPDAGVGADAPAVREFTRQFGHDVASALSSSRSTFLAIFPVEFSGKDSTIRTSLGFL